MGLQYDRTIRDHHAQRPILETRRPDAADRLADACTRVLMAAAVGSLLGIWFGILYVHFG